MALTPEAIAGLKARGYSQNQIDVVSNAAKTGGTEASKTALAGFGSVSQTPSPSDTVRNTAPIDASKVVTVTGNPGIANPLPVTKPVTAVPKSPVTADQISNMTPQQQSQLKQLTAAGEYDRANRAAVAFASQNAKSVTAPVTGSAISITKPVATSQAGVSVIPVRKKNVINPNANVTVPVTPDPLNASGIMAKTPEQLAEAKVGAISTSRDADVAAANDKLNKGLAVISQNSKAVRDLYGVDEKGNVDMENTNSLAYGIKNSLDTFKAEKNKLLSSQESSQLNRVRGTIRQSLANRGINQANVSPELLISLSGELGIQAFDSIGKLRESTVNSVLAEEKSAQEKISKLREAGVISANDAKTAVETLRSNVADVKRAIDKGYVNDVIGAAEAENTRKAAKASDLVNAVTKFGSALGLSGTGLASINSYLSKFSDPTKAVTSMLSDLSNPSSALYKSVGSVEAAKLAAARNEYDLKLLAAKATLARAEKSGTGAGTPNTLQYTIGASLGIPGQVVKDNFDTILSSVLQGKPFSIPGVASVSQAQIDAANKEYRKYQTGGYGEESNVTGTTSPAKKGIGPVTVSGVTLTPGAKNKSGRYALYGPNRQLVKDYVLDSNGTLVKV